MTPSRTRLFLIAGGVAAVSAAGFSFLLKAVATPRDFEVRAAAVEEGIEGVRRAIGRRVGDDQLGAGAICKIPLSEQSQALRTVLTSHAEQHRLKLSGMEVAPDVSVLGETLVQGRLRFRVEGDYETTVATLDMLNQARPKIFAETVELTSGSSSVTLSFSGKFFCEG